MSKPKPKKTQPSQQKRAQQASSLPKFMDVPSVSPIKTFNYQAIFIAIIGLAIYFNTFNNKYALDDDIVMRLNDYVQQGFSGIGKIMTTDSYDSFFKSMGSEGELSGGRYRPLSIVTFAVEQQIFGECLGDRFIEIKDSLNTLMRNPSTHPSVINKLIADKAAMEGKISVAHEDIASIRHIISVLLYIFSVILLLKLLRDYVFKYANVPFINSGDLAFITSVIFLVHPIHTEVVANVKSRDEILSFLFIVLTFFYVFKYEETKIKKHLWFGALCYLGALLSKEWGITLVALIPMALFIFRRYSIWDCFKSSLPYFGVAAVYMILRWKFVGAGKQGEITEVLNNPYVFATPIQKVATEIYVLLKYLKLLIFPHPLSADYSWKTIPYNNFGDALVWLSIAIHIAMVYFMFSLLRKRSWIAFAIAFYLSHLFLVSNLAMPIGATMGERLIYHSSLGFSMVVAFGLLFLLKRLTPTPSPQGEGNAKAKYLFTFLLILLIVPMGYKTYSRNPNWETDNILFMHDAWVVPNSVLANGNAGKAFIEYAAKDTSQRRAFLDSAIYHLKKATDIHPKYVNGYLNLGLAYFHQRKLDTAEYYWNEARKNFPTHPFFKQSYDPALANAFVEKAKESGKNGNVPQAIQYIARALRYDSTNTETWYHYGGANFSIGNVNEAMRGWNKCLQLNPNHTEAKKGIEALRNAMQQQQNQNQQTPKR